MHEVHDECLRGSGECLRSRSGVRETLMVPDAHSGCLVDIQQRTCVTRHELSRFFTAAQLAAVKFKVEEEDAAESFDVVDADLVGNDSKAPKQEK